jgi:hypothetical protein
MTVSEPGVAPSRSPTLAPTRPDPAPDGDGHERMAHIVLEGFRPKDGEFVAMGTNVVEGMVNGIPVQALCGKVWVPGRDPRRYPLCPTCKEIAAAMGWRLPTG